MGNDLRYWRGGSIVQTQASLQVQWLSLVAGALGPDGSYGIRALGFI